MNRCIPIIVKEQKAAGKKSDTSSAAGKCGGIFDGAKSKEMETNEFSTSIENDHTHTFSRGDTHTGPADLDDHIHKINKSANLAEEGTTGHNHRLFKIDKFEEPKFKETKFHVSKIKGEAIDAEDPDITYFYGATTLPDRVEEVLEDGRKLDGEMLSKNALENMRDMINDESRLGGKYGSYRTISLFHNRVLEQNPQLEEAGYVKADAVVEPLKDVPGHFGLKVPTTTNKMFSPPDNYKDYTPEKIQYKIDNDAIGLSVEYNNKPSQEKIVETEEGLFRYITGTNDFRGFGYARADLIGNPTAVRIKETEMRGANKMSEHLDGLRKKKKNGEKLTPEEEKQLKEGEKKMNDAKSKEQLEEDLAASEAKIKELQEQVKVAEIAKDEAKVKELAKQINDTTAEINKIKLANDETATKIKESIELAFSGVNFKVPANNAEGGDDNSAKVKEVYGTILGKEQDFVKFKNMSMERIEDSECKIKEMMQDATQGFQFEKYQTLEVKAVGGMSGKMIVVPTAKTKDVIDATDMAEGTYSQTNAMFADRFVPGITETFLMEDSFLTAMPKENYAGGNDKYQWRLWKDFTTVSGNNTLAVDPNNTAVNRTQRDFEKMETRIVEYRDGVEVTDFTQHHSMAAIGNLMEKEIMRAAEAVTDSMNADLFKAKVDATTSWLGFNGLIGVADSSTFSTIYGKVRSSTNRLLDSTLTNTFVSTGEAISVEVVRDGYEKVLEQGANLGTLVIAIHPTQMRKLWNTEDAAIRNNILTMAGAPPTFGFNRTVVPHLDGIPMIRDYRCQTGTAKDMFAVVDFNPSSGFVLVVSRPLSVRGLAKVGTSESAYVQFWGATVYKAPKNIFVHTALTT